MPYSYVHVFQRTQGEAEYRKGNISHLPATEHDGFMTIS